MVWVVLCHYPGCPRPLGVMILGHYLVLPGLICQSLLKERVFPFLENYIGSMSDCHLP